MKNNPDQSFGFLLKLETESYYRSLIFASSDNTDPTLHPKLEITYNLPNGKNDIVNSRNWQLYPNPNNGRFLIKNCNDINFIEIYNNIGAKVYSLKNKLHIYNGIDVSALEKGIYLVKISNGAKTDIQKLFIR